MNILNQFRRNGPALLVLWAPARHRPCSCQSMGWQTPQSLGFYVLVLIHFQKGIQDPYFLVLIPISPYHLQDILGGKKIHFQQANVNPFRNEYIFLFYINASLPFISILSPLHLQLQALFQLGKYIIISISTLMKSGFMFKKKKQF